MLLNGDPDGAYMCQYTRPLLVQIMFPGKRPFINDLNAIYIFAALFLTSAFTNKHWNIYLSIVYKQLYNIIDDTPLYEPVWAYC